MIVGTAGHIDHGKTTLVRALTGVDTDRLPEEKRRGISIELGYAFLDGRGGERLGFVDVPGHERLVHTMLAGATGIDFALLVVAADDGVMPQTREHLAVLAMLGIARGAIVATKADRADPARALAEARTLVAGTPLQHAPGLAVAARTGEGVDALRALLLDAAEPATPRAPRAAHDPDSAAFRLAIDRAFTLAGIGTIVTGTVHAGRVRVDDELVIVPGGRRVRVRSLHAQDRAVDEARAGQRCAAALAGVAKEEIARGQWLVAPAAALAADRVDAHVTVWRDEARPLRSGARVLAHVGAAAVAASVAVLEGDAIAPGASGRIQLVLHAAVGAWRGDRVVLRDVGAARTIAGGVVLDPFGPARYRRTALRGRELDALARGDLAALVELAPQGVDFARHAAAQGRALDAAPLASLGEGTVRAGALALGAAHARAAAEAAHTALAAFHAQQPDEPGLDAARLRRLAAPRLPAALWQAVLADMQGQGRVEAAGAFVRLPEHAARLSETERRIAQAVLPRLDEAGTAGAWVRDLARDAAEPEALMRATLARLARRGELHQVVKDLYVAPRAMAALAATARRAAGPGGEITAARFRDATGLGRKRAIQTLEYFDRIGLLRRVGDAHRLRADSGLFREEAPA
jgi:selenocysteine-specific elongation factor